jgi:hypothetical protein
MAGGFLGSMFGSSPKLNSIQSPYQQVQTIYPNLSGLTTGAGNLAGSLLKGQLPSDVAENVKNQGAAWGLTSGAGSGAGTVGGNLTLKDLGLSSLGEEQQGFSDYLNFLSGVGSETLTPTFQAQMREAEAQPDPRYAGIEKLGTSILGMIGGGM